MGLNEENISESARALQQGLSQAQKYKLARYITQKEVILQRDFICSHLKKDGIGFESMNLDKIKSIFDSSNIFEVRADLDGFQILAQIAKSDNLRMLEIADPEQGSRGVYELGEELVSLWHAEIRQKRF